MPLPDDWADEDILFFRLHPREIIGASDFQETVFYTKPSQSKGLSFFRGDMATPYSVMQHCIQSESMRKKFGETVEDFIDKGWRVGVIRAKDIPTPTFIIGEPTDNGHVNVGTSHECHQFESPAKEEFMTLSITLKPLAVVLTAEDILQGIISA